jgi:mannose-1-phosphate guanylyltransferase
MVLAAGKGMRLRPLTDDVPKPLCEVFGVPLIRFALRQLHQAGVRRAVINLHHLGARIQAHLGAQAEGVGLQYSSESRILGTGGAIRAALPLLGTDPFFVINADTLQDVDLHALAALHFASSSLATLALRSDPHGERFGLLGVRADGSIGRILNLVDDGRSITLRMFTGVHLMDHRAVEHLAADTQACVVRDAYVPLLQKGARLQAYEHPGAFHDVGTPERLATAQEALLSGRDGALRQIALGGDSDWHHPRPHVFVHKSVQVVEAELLAPCVLHKGARALDGARVGPFAVLGSGARVGRHAWVERTAVFSAAQVPDGMSARECVVTPKHIIPWPWPAARKP